MTANGGAQVEEEATKYYSIVNEKTAEGEPVCIEGKQTLLVRNLHRCLGAIQNFQITEYSSPVTFTTQAKQPLSTLRRNREGNNIKVSAKETVNKGSFFVEIVDADDDESTVLLEDLESEEEFDHERRNQPEQDLESRVDRCHQAIESIERSILKLQCRIARTKRELSHSRTAWVKRRRELRAAWACAECEEQIQMMSRRLFNDAVHQDICSVRLSLGKLFPFDRALVEVASEWEANSTLAKMMNVNLKLDEDTLRAKLGRKFIWRGCRPQDRTLRLNLSLATSAQVAVQCEMLATGLVQLGLGVVHREKQEILMHAVDENRGEGNKTRVQ